MCSFNMWGEQKECSHLDNKLDHKGRQESKGLDHKDHMEHMDRMQEDNQEHKGRKVHMDRNN